VRVLVVDDERHIRFVLGAALEMEGHEVVHADCAGRALELLDAWRFDAVLLDVMLPDADGLEVLHQVRTSRGGACSTPIVVVTALSGPEHRTEALRGGADAFVLKPFDIIEVMAQIAHVTSMDGAARQTSRIRLLAESRQRSMASSA
jgi:two-component system, OmpR family, response regulator